MSITNRQRAKWAEVALNAYRKQRGRDIPETDAQDLINDILHYAKIEIGLIEINCLNLLDRAKQSFQAETHLDSNEEF